MFHKVNMVIIWRKGFVTGLVLLMLPVFEPSSDLESICHLLNEILIQWSGRGN